MENIIITVALLTITFLIVRLLIKLNRSEPKVAETVEKVTPVTQPRNTPGATNTSQTINIRTKEGRRFKAKLRTGMSGKYRTHWDYYDEFGDLLLDPMMVDILFDLFDSEGKYADIDVYDENYMTNDSDTSIPAYEHVTVETTPEPFSEPTQEVDEPVSVESTRDVYDTDRGYDTDISSSKSSYSSSSYESSSSSTYESSSSSSYESDSSDSGSSSDD